jgi:septal ring factor EnvC (AmiA/AmiB activator)
MKRLRDAIGKRLCTLLFVGLAVSFNASSVAADDLNESKERLNKIQKQIEEAMQGLRNKESQSGTLSEELARLSTETRRIERLAQKSNQQLLELSARLEKQRHSLKEIEHQQDQTEKQIRHRLVVLYKTGEVGLIKALLSEAESPREIAEKYAFLSRMVRHDRALLAEYRQQSESHRVLMIELEALRKKQAAVVDRRKDEKEALRRARNSKKTLLAKVNQDADLLEGVVQELKAKALRLNGLVKKLETAQTQPYTGSLGGLSSQKGRLFWPVPGKLRVGFGTSRHGDLGTLIESHGFDIAAASGTPVNAVATGRVIFAKRLRGYGKLMIVDHGEKFYTLYAHVARFTKKLGDMVAAEEVIAFSGFEGRDAVYFEIRQGGKPLDPSSWLRPR